MVPCLGIGLRAIGMPSRRTSGANCKWDGLHRYALHAHACGKLRVHGLLTFDTRGLFSSSMGISVQWRHEHLREGTETGDRQRADQRRVVRHRRRWERRRR